MASVLKIDTIKSPTGNTAMTISESGVSTFSASIATPSASVPYLIATASALSDPAYNAWTERTGYYGVESKGSGIFLGGRYTPDVPGLYQVNVSAQTGASAISTFGAAIFRNGSLYRYTYSRLNTAVNTNGISHVSHVTLLNGTTDFVGGGYYMGATSGVTSLTIWLSVCLLQRTA